MSRWPLQQAQFQVCFFESKACGACLYSIDTSVLKFKEDSAFVDIVFFSSALLHLNLKFNFKP